MQPSNSKLFVSAKNCQRKSKIIEIIWAIIWNTPAIKIANVNLGCNTKMVNYVSNSTWCALRYQPPSSLLKNNPSPSFLQGMSSPPSNLQTVHISPFQAIPPLYLCWFFANPPPPSTLKIQFFSEPLNILKFFILNTILSFKSGQILKFSQFQFLLMTQKILQILMYFLCENCNPSLKVEVLSSPPTPFWTFGWRFNPNSPPSRKTNLVLPIFSYTCTLLFSWNIKLM